MSAMVIVIKKGATPAEIQAALAKFNIYPSTEKNPISSTFGLLKEEWKEDGVAYQRRIRQEWE